MIKYLVAAAALVLAGVPAAFGMVGNASFTRDIPIRIPALAQIVTPSPSVVPEPADHATPAGPRDVRTQQAEPGEDNAGQAEPGDDNGQQVEPGDDTTQHSEPGDDHHVSGSGSGHGEGSDDAGSGSDGGSAPVSGTGGGSGSDDR